MLKLSDFPAYQKAIGTLSTATEITPDIEAHRVRIADALNDHTLADLHPEFSATLTSFAERVELTLDDAFSRTNCYREITAVGP